jgi:tripartite-type tricarboxylate transporter receptor subunit TctC
MQVFDHPWMNPPIPIQDNTVMTTRARIQIVLKGFAWILLALGSLWHGLAVAQSYPARSITFVVPYPPGGAADVITRAVGQRLSVLWNRSIIIDNKGGASTQIGASYVAKSQPDGYTLLATDETTFTNPYLYGKLSYDPVKDFVAIAGLGHTHLALAVHPSFPARDIADLVAAAKAAAGNLNYATYGVGSLSHLSMALLERMAGVKLTPVHYKGGALALTDVVAGHVPIVFLTATLTAQPARSGQVRLLGIGSKLRLAQFSEVPTISESLAGYESGVWMGLFAPRGVAPDIVATVNGAVQKIMIDNDFREAFLAPNFYEPVLGTPDQFAQYVRAEATKWGKVVQDAKLTLN